MVRTCVGSSLGVSLGTMICVAAAAASCGGGGDALTKAPSQIAEVVCPKAYQCCTADKLMNNDLAGTDVASCQDLTRDEFRSQFEGIRESQRRGRAEFDQAKLDACLATIAGSTCESLNMTNHLTGVPGCDGFVIPKVAVGGACFVDWDCVGGWCDTSDPSASDGVCRPLGTEGVACEFNSECAEGFDCLNFVCRALKAEGVACTYGEDCQSGRCAPPEGMLTGSVCQAPLPPDPGMCFYESACAYAGTGPASLLGTAAFALAGLALLGRRRRRRRPRA